MLDINDLTTFLGWCIVINTGLLLLTTFMLLVFRGMVLGVHEKVTGVPADQLNVIYLQFLGHYKLAIVILNLVPWIALKQMA